MRSIALYFRQDSKHVPHVIHVIWSIICVSFILPVIALVGHDLRHNVHPEHLSDEITYDMSFFTIKSRHYFSFLYGLGIFHHRNIFKDVRIGLGAVCPKPQKDASLIVYASCRSRSLSAILPLPSVISFNICSICLVPRSAGYAFTAGFFLYEF